MSYLDAQQAAQRVRSLSTRFTLDLLACQRDRIEAALAAPAASYASYERYPSLSTKAAALIYSIAKGHACPNGNKRLAFVLAATFLVKNDRWLWADPDEVINRLEAVSASDAREGDKVKADLAEWIEGRLIEPAEAHIRLQGGLRPGATRA